MYHEPVLAQRRRIAVIGGGITGLGAAWLLNRRHDITVYERAPRVGGHANTCEPEPGVPVDTGFIVYNTRTYPNLTALFDHLAVPTSESDMSFAASLGGGALEYAGSDRGGAAGLANGIFGQRRNLARPRFWRMIADLLRFYREAPALLDRPAPVPEPTLGDWLAAEGYGPGFVEDHLLPMAAAIWSGTPGQMRDYPVRAFVRFFVNHGLLSLGNRPRWRTVTGGSRAYVARLSASFADRIVHRPVVAVARDAHGVAVRDASGLVQRFDEVVIATHADEALGLLCDPDAEERRLLGAWRYATNRAVLHRDPRLMPRRRRVWSSWNVLGAPGRPAESVTYWMNRLQPLATRNNWFVTLNPVTEPDPALVAGEFSYDHPVYDPGSMATQAELWSLQGRNRTWFCGSYFGYGFHEDGLQAGLAVAEALGGLRRPWRVPGENDRLTVRPMVAPAGIALPARAAE